MKSLASETFSTGYPASRELLCSVPRQPKHTCWWDCEVSVAFDESPTVEDHDDRTEWFARGPRTRIEPKKQTILGAIDRALWTHVECLGRVVCAIRNREWGLRSSETILSNWRRCKRYLLPITDVVGGRVRTGEGTIIKLSNEFSCRITEGRHECDKKQTQT